VTGQPAQASAAVTTGQDCIVATGACLPDHVAIVGGKAVGLSALLRAGQRVPASFVITAAAYQEYLDTGARGLTPAARDAIMRAYAALCEPRGSDLPVAVRSSAAAEDSADASYAGQFRTFLGATGIDEVLAQVEQCWIAASAPGISSYSAGRQQPADSAVAVIIQEMVDARAAGVMFTQHPRTGDRSLVVIESSYGLGEAVVGGEVVPDLFEVNRITRRIHSSRIGKKSIEHRLAADGRAVHVLPVDPARQNVWSICDDEIARLVTLAGDLDARLGRGLDVEWAIGTTPGTVHEEALYALQARPITVVPRQRPAARPKAEAVDHILSRLAGRPPEDDARHSHRS
jgi:phosphoenolpyruvate synthase/pyruvate phosphate dikinase